MWLFNYVFMCLYIGTYLYYQWNGASMPDAWRTANVWVSWAFLAWTGLMSIRIIISCLQLSAKGEMTPTNVQNGILLAVLDALPVILMSTFMLRQGFTGK